MIDNQLILKPYKNEKQYVRAKKKFKKQRTTNFKINKVDFF